MYPFFPQTFFQSRLPHNTEQFTVQYNRSLLVIHFKYSSVYMLISSSLSHPLSFPKRAINLLSKLVSLFLFLHDFFLDSTYEGCHMIFSSSVWLASLKMTLFGSIHVAANSIISFLFYSWVIFHCIYVPHLLYPFLCQWTLGCFHVLATINRKHGDLAWMDIKISQMCFPHLGKWLYDYHFCSVNIINCITF